MEKSSYFDSELLISVDELQERLRHMLSESDKGVARCLSVFWFWVCVKCFCQVCLLVVCSAGFRCVCWVLWVFWRYGGCFCYLFVMFGVFVLVVLGLGGCFWCFLGFYPLALVTPW